MNIGAAAIALGLAVWASGAVKTEVIDYKDGDTALRGYLAYDDAQTGKRPGVLVCHEWWGNNEYSRKRAERLAALGYVAFALDMYGSGVTTDDPGKAQELAGALYKDAPLVRRRAAAGLKVLADHPLADKARIAAIGYCMGGTVALELARSGADLGAVVSFHGGLDTREPASKGVVKAKILVCTGAADPMVPPEQRIAFEKEMEGAGVDFVLIEYAGAKHAFTNPAADSFGLEGVGYNESADRRSWRHMLDFFGETIGPARGPAEGGQEGDPGGRSAPGRGAPEPAGAGAGAPRAMLRAHPG